MPLTAACPVVMTSAPLSVGLSCPARPPVLHLLDVEARVELGLRGIEQQARRHGLIARRSIRHYDAAPRVPLDAHGLDRSISALPPECDIQLGQEALCLLER